jgi:hypothetical protein
MHLALTAAVVGGSESDGTRDQPYGGHLSRPAHNHERGSEPLMPVSYSVWTLPHPLEGQCRFDPDVWFRF